MLRMAEGDAQGLVALMTDDAVVYADGGGVVSAAIAPVYGRERIAQVFLHLAAKAQAEGALDFEFKPMNGGWGLVVMQQGAVHSCFQVALKNGLIQEVYVVRNPEKLTQFK